jgi:hypothetical protein
MSQPIQTTESTTSHNPSTQDDKVRPPVVAKGWTIGNSANLVEGSEREPRWVSVAWFAVPTGIAVAMFVAMAYLFGS